MFALGKLKCELVIINGLELLVASWNSGIWNIDK